MLIKAKVIHSRAVSDFICLLLFDSH